MNNKVCCFFGHKHLYDSVEVLGTAVRKQVEGLIGEGYCEFLFGGYGLFDELCFRVVNDLKRKYPHIKTVYVHAYYKYNDAMFLEYLKKYDETLYSEIEDKPLKFAISYRNQKMIEASDFCVFYVAGDMGGAYQAMRYARRMEKNSVNLAEIL